MIVIKGGCGTRHSISFVMSRPEGLKNYLLLIIRSKSLFIINGIKYSVDEGSALIISPYTPYSYSNPTGLYTDDWLHWDFECNHPDTVKLPPLNTPFKIGDHTTYTAYIQQILWEHSFNISEHSRENIKNLFHIVFNHLNSAYKNRSLYIERSEHLEKLHHIRLIIQNRITEQHDVQQLAKKTGLSLSYFQNLYRRYFNISFQQDIIRMRVEYVSYLISTTNLSMEVIAESCGYSNHVHFFRQFKKIMGVTPAKYRKSQ